MSLRPKRVHWFEAEVPREHSVYALETLAGTGSVQLEDKGYHELPCVDATALRRHISRLDKLIRRYAADLPPVDENPEKHLGRPEKIAETAVNRVRNWASKLLETKRLIRQIEIETDRLRLLFECLTAIGGDAQGLGAMGHSTDLLYKHIFACPHGQIKEAVFENGVFENVYHGNIHDFWFIVGLSDRQDVLNSAAVLVQCTPVIIPEWLPKKPAKQRQILERRLQDLKDQRTDLDVRLESLRTDTEVGSCLYTARLLRWYLNIAIDQTVDHQACHLTGWTTVASPEELEECLAAAGIRAELIFAPPRGDLKPPVSLDSGRWSHPFGLFVQLLGTPGRYEIDPTPLVAIIVPLLFGFMFPDLGHGLILAAAGVLLARYNKSAMILVPCGLVASVFGLLFGEAFGLHDLFPSPFGCPLDHPLQILIATVLLGVSLILLGLFFSGIEAWWRGEIVRWMLEEAPIITLYISAALTLVLPVSWVVSVLSLIWYLIGIGILCWREGGKCILKRVGHLLESSFQLVVATFSFLRVGAFALAHAGFSVVVLELIHQIDTPFLQALTFILGHIFIIVAEGVIVMIQTTRLVLFEFFMRFLRFEGRIYKPLEKPVAGTSGS